MKRRLVYSRACTTMLLSPLPFNLQEISLYITGPKEKHYLHIICKTISHPYDPYGLTFSIKKHISVLFVSFHIVRQNSPFFFYETSSSLEIDCYRLSQTAVGQDCSCHEDMKK